MYESHIFSKHEGFLDRSRVEVQYKAVNRSHFKLKILNVILPNCFYLKHFVVLMPALFWKGGVLWGYCLISVASLCFRHNGVSVTTETKERFQIIFAGDALSISKNRSSIKATAGQGLLARFTLKGTLRKSKWKPGLNQSSLNKPKTIPHNL